MKKVTIRRLLAISLIALLWGSGYLFWTNIELTEHTAINQSEKLLENVKQNLDKNNTEAKEESAEFKKARSEYFHKILRDPATNSIPANNRSREISYARQLPTFQQLKQKMGVDQAAQVEDHSWSSAGPTDVGGRTRALGIDRRNSDIIIAGAVSGGIWKSTNDGNTWELKTPDAENLSVTSLAQHPTNQDTWYYTSGEFLGNSASAEGGSYYGTGIFRSTDNGETWSQIPSSDDSDGSYNSRFDFMSRIRIHPSGTIYVASNGFGILRSPNGDDFSDITLGERGLYAYADVAIATDGKIIATLSSADVLSDQDPANNPGVFLSEDNGQSWTEITPNDFPAEFGRSVVTFAPSNPDIAYVLTHVRKTDPEDSHQEDNRLYRLNLATGVATDLSSNIPNYGGSVGQFWTQGGYDMEIAVKPDDENFVLIGGTNLFRGRDGFASSPPGGYDQNNVDEYWIGGYTNENSPSSYPNQHPDQHIIKFDPDNPDRLWAGHDGGLSVTNDITASRVYWTSKNNAYITTQFYTSAIPAIEDDNRLMGGTQDNGTPFFRFESNQSTDVTSSDISFGDGGYAFFTQSRFFVSRQNGSIIRYNVAPNGDIAGPYAFVFPSAAENQEFIHPYTIDPNNQNNLYYPDGNDLWRSTEAATIMNQDSDGVTEGFGTMETNLPNGYTISALEVSHNPENILYYAGSNMENDPIINKLENASVSNETPDNISIPTAPDSSWVIDLAVNPNDANEVIAVFSNYNITGLFHTTDGGQNWTAIEGNLTGDSNNLGPSLRSAVMIPSDEGVRYVVGTSTGIWTTGSLDGSNTQWGQEAVDQIGNAVVSHLSTRISDGDIAAATHGRGMYLGNFEGTNINPRLAEEFALRQNFPNPFEERTTIEYDIPVESVVSINLYDVLGRKVRTVVQNERKAAFKGWKESINMEGMASGIYVYSLKAEPLTDTVSTFYDAQKMTFIKR